MPVSCLSLTWDCSVELLIFFWAAVMGIQTALDETILPLIRIISSGKILHVLVPKVELIGAAQRNTKTGFALSNMTPKVE